MDIIFHPDQRLHYPKRFLVRGDLTANPEKPERTDVLLNAVRAAGHNIAEPEDFDLVPIAAIHTPEYIEFLATIHQRWQALPGASDEVLPNIHANRHVCIGYPQSPVGLAGYHMADTACPINADTWNSVKASCNSAVHAAQLVLDDIDSAYALCRPPGHHAYQDMAGGFCYVNNSAVAAQVLRQAHGRVAVLDIDVHHGNGTQGIFYRRDDVLTVSLHADPQQFYPFFWGYAAERGEGQGQGYNLNFPLPLATADDAYLQSLELALNRIQAFQATALVVALGLDAYVNDPLAGLAITTEGFGRIATAISRLQLPTVLVQEGGYLSAELGENLVSFLQAWSQ